MDMAQHLAAEGRERHVELYEYPDGNGKIPAISIEGLTDPGEKNESEEEENKQEPSSELLKREHDMRLNEATQKALALGREQGRQLEREAHAEALEQLEEQQKQQYASLIEGFTQGRDRYYAQIEPEAVKLALHIAARILRREAQMDPLLLTGAVRVALGQLSSSTTVRLRVPAQDASMWQQAMALVPNLNLKLEILAIPEMHLGECELETELGSVDLGLRAQLSEIERGFFDRIPREHAKAKKISATEETEGN